MECMKTNTLCHCSWYLLSFPFYMHNHGHRRAKGGWDRDGKMAIEYDFTMAFIDFITCIRTNIKCWMPGHCALNELGLLYACICGRHIMWRDIIRWVFIISLNCPLLLFCVIILMMTLTVFTVSIFNENSLPLHIQQCAFRYSRLHCTFDARWMPQAIVKIGRIYYSDCVQHKICEWF